MKPLLCLFTGFLLLSSAVHPCTGKGQCEGEYHSRSVAPVLGEAGCCSHKSSCEAEAPSPEEKEEDCAHLCICPCCGITFIAELRAFQAAAEQPKAQPPICYIPFVGSDFRHLIWQPPPFLS